VTLGGTSRPDPFPVVPLVATACSLSPGFGKGKTQARRSASTPLGEKFSLCPDATVRVVKKSHEQAATCNKVWVDSRTMYQRSSSSGARGSHLTA